MSIDSLLLASMPPESMKCEPFDIAALDAHIDGPRIWRTIDAIRSHYKDNPDEIQDRKDAQDEERGETVKRLRAAFDTFVDGGFTKEHLAELSTELDALEEEFDV